MATDSPVCISVINMKGGVGKTTVAALLGRQASLAGLKVLAIDLDPQANLSQAFMGGQYRQFLADKRPSIVELFNGFRPPTPTKRSPTSMDFDDVVISNTSTNLGGRNLDIIPSRFDFSDQLIDAARPDQRILANVIAESSQDWDVVLIDCAPTESILTRVAYQASRYVLVPVRPEFFATVGFPLLKDSLDHFKSRNRGHTIDVAGIVINNASYHLSGNRGGPERRMSIREIEREATENQWHIFQRQLPFSRGFPKITRGDFSHPGYSVAGFASFANEFFKHIGLDDRT